MFLQNNKKKTEFNWHVINYRVSTVDKQLREHFFVYLFVSIEEWKAKYKTATMDWSRKCILINMKDCVGFLLVYCVSFVKIKLLVWLACTVSIFCLIVS